MSQPDSTAGRVEQQRNHAIIVRMIRFHDSFPLRPLIEEVLPPPPTNVVYALLNRVLGIQRLDSAGACTLFLLLRRLSAEETYVNETHTRFVLQLD